MNNSKIVSALLLWSWSSLCFIVSEVTVTWWVRRTFTFSSILRFIIRVATGRHCPLASPQSISPRKIGRCQNQTESEASGQSFSGLWREFQVQCSESWGHVWADLDLGQLQSKLLSISRTFARFRNWKKFLTSNIKWVHYLKIIFSLYSYLDAIDWQSPIINLFPNKNRRKNYIHSNPPSLHDYEFPKIQGFNKRSWTSNLKAKLMS